MEYNDNFNPAYDNDFDTRKVLDDTKKIDRGYNVIWRMRPRPDGSLKRTKIEIYTSGDIGTHIRDAETGIYYNNKVGSADEDLFFKVGLSTGECKSKNGSSTMFYTSPHHYMSHMGCDLDANLIARWESKHNDRIKEAKFEEKSSNMSAVIVN
jgi:hypothetical protein